MRIKLIMPVLILPMLTGNAFGTDNSSTPAVFDGTSIKDETIIRPDGGWYYFPDEILTPAQALARLAEADQPPTVVTPGSDLNQQLGREDTAFYHGTYLLILTNFTPGEYAGSDQQIYSSSRFFVFNKDTASAAKPVLDLGLDPDNPENSLPILATQPAFSFTVTDKQPHYMLIQAANYHHGWSGMWQPPQIGRNQAILMAATHQTRADFAIIGIVFFVSLYSFAIYIRRPEDKASLLLALCSLSFAVRTFVITQWDSNLWGDHELTFEMNHKIIYSWFTGGISLFLGFVHFCFPKQTTKWLIPAILITQIPIYLWIATHDVADYFSLALPMLDGATIILTLISVYILVRAVLARESGAWFSFTGFLIVGAASVNDLFWSMGLPYLFVPAIGIGFALFFVFNSQIVAKRFAQAFRQAERLSRELQVEVDRQTRDIKSILRNIKQGIFTIDGVDKPIGDDHSQFLEELVGESNLANRTARDVFLSRLKLNSDTQDQILNVLDASLGESILNFEINQALLPCEVEYQSPGQNEPSLLSVDWNPVLNAADEIEKILVSIRDITEIRRLTLQNQQHEEDMQMLIELIQIPEDRFQRFIAQTNEYLKDNRELINLTANAKPEVIKRLFINMHTIKGAARTFLLKSLSSAAHDVEKIYQGLQQNKTLWDQKSLLRDISDMEHLVNKYQYVGEEKLGWQLTRRSIKIPASICESLTEDLLQVGNDQLSERQSFYLNRARKVLYEYSFVRLESVLKEAFSGIESMARDLDKENPKLDITSAPAIIRDRGVNLLHGLLVHMIRNSMDHGIETPHERQKLGKSPQGTIRLSSRITATGTLVIDYEDDGGGLDLEKIRRCAIAKGLTTEQDQLTDQVLADLIFQSGLTTKDQASDISGRGVGMDAVRNHAMEQGGDVSIILRNPHPQAAYRPFCIRLTMPDAFWFQLGDDALGKAS
jgi:signal transduction histidine kinase/uncharacterized membrane protein